MTWFFFKLLKCSHLFLISFFLLTSCSDGGGSPSAAFALNSAPTISGSISTIRVGEELNFTPSANDTDGDNLAFSIVGMPAWANFDESSGLLSGVAAMTDLDSISVITIRVSDGQLDASISFDLTVTKPIFFISIGIDSLDAYRDMDIELSACFIPERDDQCSVHDELLTIRENGTFRFQGGLETGVTYSLNVDRDPGRQDCALEVREGVIGSSDKTINVICEADESAPLFALDKMHNIRITISNEEWDRFVLDTTRASYLDGDAHGNIPLFNDYTHSEVYRQVDFEYLDQEGQVVQKYEKVGFKMKGNSRRQWPEYFYNDANGEAAVKPKRFGFGIKFDEKFDEDEGVYSCIDATGNPASIAAPPCRGRVGKNLEEVFENDNRKFMGLEKIFFKFAKDDQSYQRELLAHDILNSLGVPSSRVSHANVELVVTGHGEFYGNSLPASYSMGVFQLFEQIDKPFLKRYFGKNGYLFKMGYGADLAGSREISQNCIFYEEATIFEDPNFCDIGIEKPDPDSREEWLGSANYLNPSFVNDWINYGVNRSQFRPYKPPYDLKTKKKSVFSGRVLLQDFIRFIQTYPTSSMLAEEFDILGFIRAQATEIVFGAVDHYVRVANNYYLFLNPITGKWVYMANDFDFVFRDNHELSSSTWPTAFRDIAATYVFPAEGKIDWAGRLVGDVNPILWNIVFSEESNKTRLYLEIKSILDDHFDWSILGPRLEERNNLVKTAIAQTEAGFPDGCSYIYNQAAIAGDSDAELCDAADISIKRFVELRRATLYQELEENGF